MNIVKIKNTNETLCKNKLHFYRNNKCIIVPEHMKYWSNYDLTKYSEYCHKKFINNLENINNN